MSAAKAAGEKGIRCESGAIQSLCTGVVCKPLGNWEGQTCDDRSQETCLGAESQIRCLRVDLPASLSAPGLFALRATDDTVRENGCGNAAVFIFLSEHFEKR